MLTCRKIEKHSTEYLDQELTLWQRMQYKFHLFLCYQCRRYLRHLKTTLVLLKKRSIKPVDQDRVDQIVQAIKTNRE